jgi:hypothetical protein
MYLIILQLPVKPNFQRGIECHIKHPNQFFFYFDYSAGIQGKRNNKRLVGVTQHICVTSLEL